MESLFRFLFFITFLHLLSSSSSSSSSPSTTSITNQTTNHSNTTSKTKIRHEDRLQKWQTRLEKIVAASKQPSTSENFCHCDLSSDHCDVDCCCDQGCNRLERLAFVHCRSDAQEEKHFCHSSAHIFNRKRLTLDRQSSRLLCVARTNTRQASELSYANRPVITDYSGPNLGLSKLEQAYFTFKWASPVTSSQQKPFSSLHPITETGDHHQLKAMLEYRSGFPILITRSLGNESSLEQWKLPATLDGRDCNHRALIGYLHDYQASCWRPFTNCKDFEKEEEEFTSRIRFHYYDFVAEEYRSVKVEVERGDDKKKITLDPCTGIISSLKYTVHHRGIYGITRVVAKIRYYPPVNVQTVRRVKTHFTVHFRWDASGNGSVNGTTSSSNSTATNGTIHLAKKAESTFYSRGSPLLFAHKQANESLVALEPANVSSLLIGTFEDGLCSENQKVASNQIRFGLNQMTSCRLALNVPSIAKKEVCAHLEKVIGKFGPIFRSTNMSSLAVSAFGNVTTSSFNSSNFSTNAAKENWVPVLVLPSTTTDDQQTTLGCEEVGGKLSILHTSTSWQIFYARVGPKALPKLKIVGVTVKRSGHLNHLEVKCPSPLSTAKKEVTNSTLCSLALDTELSSTVAFIDVTLAPAVPDYAPAPSLRLELPSDFFYPFIATSSAAGAFITNSCPLLVFFISSVAIFAA